MHPQPVIKYEYLSRPLELLITALVGFTILFTGFIMGIAVSMNQPTLPPIQLQIPLPESQVHPFQPGSFGEPVIYSAGVDWRYDQLADEVKCLADNMYFEGRNQTLHGKIGIGIATINRVKNKHFKNNVCDVVWFQANDRRTGKLTAHFSWTLDGKSDKIGNKKVYAKIYRIADAMLAEGSLDNFVDFLDGATHYHADYVNPYWADDMTLVAQIDDHVYYK